MKLFWYTRVEGEKELQDSINLEKVIRSIELSDGSFLVLLDDIHERIQEVPIVGSNGKQKGTKNVRGTFQTEIYLVKPEDIENFKKLTNE